MMILDRKCKRAFYKPIEYYKTNKRSHSIFGLVNVRIVLNKSKYFKFILILTNSSNNKIELQYTPTRN